MQQIDQILHQGNNTLQANLFVMKNFAATLATIVKIKAKKLHSVKTKKLHSVKHTFYRRHLQTKILKVLYCPIFTLICFGNFQSRFQNFFIEFNAFS